jgi:hypothetical protein
MGNGPSHQGLSIPVRKMVDRVEQLPGPEQDLITNFEHCIDSSGILSCLPIQLCRQQQLPHCPSAFDLHSQSITSLPVVHWLEPKREGVGEYHC